MPKIVGTNVGRLEKTIVTYKNYGTKLFIKRDESEQYSSNDIVKFSYHADGFVQFSSATNKWIKSGRKADGTPKGLGIISHPLNNPISTGPSKFRLCLVYYVRTICYTFVNENLHHSCSSKSKKF